MATGRQKNFLFTLNTTALPVLPKMGAKKAANLFQDLLLSVLLVVAIAMLNKFYAMVTVSAGGCA